MNRISPFLMALTTALALSLPLMAQQNEVELVDTIASSKITSDRIWERNSTQTGLERLDKGKIWRGFAFLSTPDVIKSLQALPGVATGSELMSGLYVHGGDGNDNLFLLDGVPMYQVSHLAGLFSSFNTDIVETVDFYKSGFPGRFGGRLSSVVDVKTEDGNFQKYNGTFSIGLIDGRIQFGGPIVRDKLSFNAAMRRSWLDVLTIPTFAIINAIGKKNQDNLANARYSFYDANANLTWLATQRSRMTARFYMGSDFMKGKESISNRDFFNDFKYILFMKARTRWGNILGSLAWETRFSESLRLSARAYYSQNKSSIAFEIDDQDNNDTGIHVNTREYNRSLVREVGAKADLIWKPHHRHILRIGAKYAWSRYNPRHTWETGVSLGSYSDDLKHGSSEASYTSHEVAIYAEDEITLARWMKINAGIRYSPVFVGRKTWHMAEPRAALTFICSDMLSIKASYSRMNQVPHMVATTYIDLPANCWMPSTEKISPSRSDQVAAGLYFKLPHNIDLNIEGYYKTMDHLLEYCGAGCDVLSPLEGMYPPLDSWETEFEDGRGRAYGLETSIGWHTRKVDLDFYYTLSWSERNFPSIYGEWYPDHYDNRHKITIMGNYKFSKKFDIYAAWNYHSGNRITAALYTVNTGNYYIECYDQPNNVGLPAYHRLDVGMNFHKTTKKGRESIWNVSIYNVYCRMNPMMGNIDTDENGNYVLNTVGMIPVIPTFSYTLKF